MWRFNTPPGWPVPPAGWVPPRGWTPDPAWPAAPEGWQFWVEERSPGAGLPPSPPPSAPRRNWIWVVLAAALAMLVLAGLLLGLLGLGLRSGRQTVTTDFATTTKGGAVEISNPCGSISVREGAAGVVSTKATLRYGWRRPSVTSQAHGNDVEVSVRCPAFGFGSGASLQVEVPPGTPVAARSAAGSVTAAGLRGNLTLHSSAGSVTAVDVASSVVSADSSAGAVSLTFAANSDPTSITARSSAGGVRVLVPDVASVAYRVDARTSAGRTSVQVRTDPQATRTINATSSAGSVLVAYR